MNNPQPPINPIPPINLQSPAPAPEAPKPTAADAKTPTPSWNDKSLKVKHQTSGAELELLPFTGNRSKLTYPSIWESEVNEEGKHQAKSYTKEQLAAIVDSIKAFESDQFNQLVIDAYDNYLYTVYTSAGVKGDIDKFVTAITSPDIQRMPKSMSVHYMRLITSTKKAIGEEKDPVKKAALSATIPDLLTKYQEAVMAEIA